MEHAPATTQAWALLLDPASAHAVIENLSKLRLPRRICRPLDRRQERIENSELAKFDAAVEAAVEAEAASDGNLADVQAEAASDGKLAKFWSARAGAAFMEVTPRPSAGFR